MAKVAFSKVAVGRMIDLLREKGETIGRIEIKPDGEVVILTGTPEATLTPLERWRAERDRGAPKRSA